MNVPYNVVLDEVIYVEEKEYQKVKKKLSKNDDYFGMIEMINLLIDRE